MGRKSREKANRTGPSAGNLRRQEIRERPIREVERRARKAAEERRTEDERYWRMSGRGPWCRAIPPRPCRVGLAPPKWALCPGTWSLPVCTSPLNPPPPEALPDDPPELQQRLPRRPLGIAGLLAMAALGAVEMGRRP